MEDFFEFAYLDKNKVQKYLAQLDHGIVNRRVIRETASRTNEAKGGAGITGLFQTSGGIGRSSESQNEITIENSPEGEFARFYEYLCSQSDFIQETHDSISFEHLPRRGFCEIEGVIRVPSIRQNIARAFQIGSLQSDFSGGNVEVDETIQKMELLFQTDKVPVTINNDEGKPVILTVLYNRSFFIPLEEIEEEYSLLGKIIKIIKPNDPPYDLLKEIYNPKISHNLSPLVQRKTLMTMPELSRKSSEDLPIQLDLKLEGPLVVLSPIAIYR